MFKKSHEYPKERNYDRLTTAKMMAKKACAALGVTTVTLLGGVGQLDHANAEPSGTTTVTVNVEPGFLFTPMTGNGQGYRTVGSEASSIKTEVATLDNVVTVSVT
jgi:hypothetical protein